MSQSLGPVPDPGPPLSSRLAFLDTAASSRWGDADRRRCLEYVPPGEPAPHRYRHEIEEEDEQWSRWAVAEVRGRARDGEARALAMLVRQTEPARRAVGETPRPPSKRLPPEVAAAMLDAGLVALGETLEEIPVPVRKVGAQSFPRTIEELPKPFFAP